MNNVGPLESTPCEKQFDLVKGVEVLYPPRTKAATGTEWVDGSPCTSARAWSLRSLKTEPPWN